MQKRREKTNLKNIGVKHPAQAKDFVEKLRIKWRMKTDDDRR